jgi:hypothetical protein
MRALASPELLAVWEWGEDRHTIDRSLALLAAAMPEASWDELAALPVGRRDALLLELRWRSFGSLVEAHAPCSACGETMEIELEIRDLLDRAGDTDDTEIELEMDGWEIRCRLPDSRDLAAVVGCADDQEGRGLLLDRCVTRALRNGNDHSATELPPQVIDELSQRLEAADPLAVIEIQATCPECGHGDSELLDAGSLVWSEVRTEADRLLREVDVLARRYGWTEDEVLALGPRRRRAYLELET